MKIALAQINTRVGDLKNNSIRIIDFIHRARKAQADLVVFPELSICGYPPEDLVEKKIFVKRNTETLNDIMKHTDGIGVLCGFVSPNENPEGHHVFNAAALVENGKIIGIQHKSLLPNYDVFDEMRHFEPAKEKKVFPFRGMKLGIGICEDSWNDKDFWKQRLYHSDPIEELINQGANILVNMSASPFHVNKSNLRLNMFKSISQKYHIPCVFVNLVGGNDSLIFDGCSFVLDAEGQLLAQAQSFAEELAVVDIEANRAISNGWTAPDEQQIYDALILGIRDYMSKCGFKKAIIGLSGGIDSALVAAISVEALGKDHIIGVSMPSRYSSEHSKDDAKKLATNLGIEYRSIPIESMFNAFLESMHSQFKNLPEDITEENIQARLRGNILMALSNKLNAMVLSTGNKSELAAGYCTLYGDMCGGLAVISDVPKTMVYRIARWINREKEIIPPHTIIKPPSAELKPNQTDQDTLPPYDVLDGILEAYIENMREEEEIIQLGYDEQTVKKVLKLVDHNEYKRRQAAPGLRVTTKAFGFGRRLPIAQGWR
ncbi:NAD+ synthase [bacterium]|nr:NAD+ synthase [bacterium]